MQHPKCRVLPLHYVLDTAEPATAESPDPTINMSGFPHWLG